TVTEATGTVVTVIAAVLVFPSLVAVIVAEPGEIAVTSRLGHSVATVVSLLFHVTVRPARVPPAESFGVAVICVVCPTRKEAAAGETVTEATGTVVTVIAAVLVFPSLVAVIVAEPGATPVTWPLELTAATLVLPLIHVTVRPVSVPPAESFGVAVSCSVCPTRTVAVAGEIVTEATAVSGVTDAVGTSCPTTGTETPTTTLATATASAESMRPFGVCASAGVTPGRQLVAGSHGGTAVAVAPLLTRDPAGLLRGPSSCPERRPRRSRPPDPARRPVARSAGAARRMRLFPGLPSAVPWRGGPPQQTRRAWRLPPRSGGSPAASH